MSTLISIYSYNIAGKKQYYAEDFMMKVFYSIKSQMEKPELMIFCFQEMDSHYMKGKYFSEEYDIVSIQNGCQGTSNKFNLSTIIFQKNPKNFFLQIQKIKKCTHLGMYGISSYFGSKGAIYTILTLNDKKYFLINTHAPFASEKGIMGGSYSDFWNIFISSQIKKNKMEGKTIIVGDLNSRSLINPNLDIRKTPTIKNAEDQHFRYRAQNQYNPRPLMFKAQVQQLMNKAQNQKSMTRREEQNLRTLKQRLRSGDYLTFFMNNSEEEHMQNINMRDIGKLNFLPTYKISEEKKQYKLMKKEHLRLPGYADRILTDIDPMMINDISYTSVKTIGSDHFPVMATFYLN